MGSGIHDVGICDIAPIADGNPSEALYRGPAETDIASYLDPGISENSQEGHRLEQLRLNEAVVAHFDAARAHDSEFPVNAKSSADSNVLEQKVELELVPITVDQSDHSGDNQMGSLL